MMRNVYNVRKGGASSTTTVMTMTERTRHCHPLLLLLHANLVGVMILDVVNAIQRPVQVVSICSSYQFIDQVDGHKTHPCPLMTFHVSVV